MSFSKFTIEPRASQHQTKQGKPGRNCKLLHWEKPSDVPVFLCDTPSGIFQRAAFVSATRLYRPPDRSTRQATQGYVLRDMLVSKECRAIFRRPGATPALHEDWPSNLKVLSHICPLGFKKLLWKYPWIQIYVHKKCTVKGDYQETGYQTFYQPPHYIAYKTLKNVTIPGK